MKIRISAIVGLCVAAMTLIGVHGTCAEPIEAPLGSGKSWQLDFSFEMPQLIMVKDAEGQARWYWFLTYKVVNNTKADRLFVPEFTVATARGDLLTAGEGVSGSIFQAVKQRLRNDLLLSPFEVIGPLLQGEDYAKESVAIWPVFPHDVDQMDVFAANLSGETEVIKNPVSGEPVVLSRTLMISFSLPGSDQNPSNLQLDLNEQRWVMR